MCFQYSCSRLAFLGMLYAEAGRIWPHLGASSLLFLVSVGLDWTLSDLLNVPLGCSPPVLTLAAVALTVLLCNVLTERFK